MRINTIRLRIWLGCLAILLPWIVALLNRGFPDSISATYYVPACITPFMGILVACSVILMCYKGYDRHDDIILSLSGFFGLLICLFPTYSSEYSHVGTFQVSPEISSLIHDLSAFVFFGLLAYNSMFLFTKGDGNPTPNKKKRNIIYRVCAVGMIGSFSMLLLPPFPIQIWLLETIALSFFGISFLTKADVFPFLFCDTPYTD